MIYFIAAAIFLFFALSILCIFGIISGITGMKEVDAMADPHWGLNYGQQLIKSSLRDSVARLSIYLIVSVFLLLGFISVAYHLPKGPIL